MTYDSRPDTWQHIHEVQWRMNVVIGDLIGRAHRHDQSKLSDEERPYFDVATPKLAGLTYGSDEYKAALKELGPALRHHQAKNSHHPEFYENGMRGMNLLDLIEMLCDWKAATLRHNDGDILRSIEINQARFGYSDDVKALLVNTIRNYGWHSKPFQLHDTSTP